MSNKKKSFLLHIDSLDILDDLTNGQAGVLFKAIKAYQHEEDFPLDSVVKIAFSPFKNQFFRDDEKYVKTCERRAIAGSKGGKQKVANASNSKQEVANVADSNNKNKNKTKNKSDNNKEVIKDIVVSTPVFNFKNELLSLGVDKDILNDWMKVRKNKNATNTESAFRLLVSQISKSGLTIDQGIRFANSENWGAFKLTWYQNKQGASNERSQGNTKKPSAYERARANNAEYRQEQPNECEMGVGTASRDLGRTVDEGTRGNTFIELDNGTFVDY